MIRPGSDGTSPTAPPLQPTGDEARRWAVHELSDPAYAAAHPTTVDRIARAIEDFFARLFGGEAAGPWGAWLAVAALVVVLALLVTAVLLWGRPRLRRRARTLDVELFGDVERRSADRLRRAADAAAGLDDWNEAIVLRFRALARGLAERGLLDTPPGTTVHGFARSASLLFPSETRRLDAAATAFDAVRYLGVAGTAGGYDAVVAADEGVRTTVPAGLPTLPSADPRTAQRTPEGAIARRAR
jgi:hypothetical protein